MIKGGSVRWLLIVMNMEHRRSRFVRFIFFILLSSFLHISVGAKYRQIFRQFACHQAMRIELNLHDTGESEGHPDP
jgi:hypothetical protein